MARNLTLSSNGYTAAGTLKTFVTSSRRFHQQIKPKKHICGDYFHGKYVAFTGPLKSMSRGEAMYLVNKSGGNISSTVSKKTNIVVTNVKNINSLTLDQMSTKLRKAMLLIEQGLIIEIIDETRFTELLYQ